MSFTLAIIRLNLYLACSFLFLHVLPSAPSQTKAKVHTVEIKQMKFRPAEVFVSKGDSVVFVNRDMVTHDATEASGKAWKSPALANGEKWGMVVSRSSSYFCSFHPGMKGKLRIK